MALDIQTPEQRLARIERVIDYQQKRLQEADLPAHLREHCESKLKHARELHDMVSRQLGRAPLEDSTVLEDFG